MWNILEKLEILLGPFWGKYHFLTEYIYHEDKKLCMLCSLFGSLVSGRADSQNPPRVIFVE